MEGRTSIGLDYLHGILFVIVIISLSKPIEWKDMFSLLFTACSIYNIIPPEILSEPIAIQITEFSELVSFGEVNIEFFNKPNIYIPASIRILDKGVRALGLLTIFMLLESSSFLLDFFFLRFFSFPTSKLPSPSSSSKKS